MLSFKDLEPRWIDVEGELLRDFCAITFEHIPQRIIRRVDVDRSGSVLDFIFVENEFSNVIGFRAFPVQLLIRQDDILIPLLEADGDMSQTGARILDRQFQRWSAPERLEIVIK